MRYLLRTLFVVVMLLGLFSLATAKKAKLVIVIPRKCLQTIDFTEATECVVEPKNMHCGPVVVTHYVKCEIVRVVK